MMALDKSHYIGSCGVCGIDPATSNREYLASNQTHKSESGIAWGDQNNIASPSNV